MNQYPFEIRKALLQQGPMNSQPASPPSSRAAGALRPSVGGTEAAANVPSASSTATIHRWMEGMEEAVVVHDAGMILQASPRASALFDRGGGAILGLHFKELITNESLMRLLHFLEFDDSEPAVVLALGQDDHRTFPLELRAIGSILRDGRRLRVTLLTRCGAIERAGDAAARPSA